MKNNLEKYGIMYYPFFRILNISNYLRLCVLAFSLLGVVLFQHIAFAQSDEAIALESSRQGHILQNKGEFKKALFYYQRALVLQPDCAAYLNDIGLMQEYIGSTKDAEKSYLEAIEMDIHYLPSYANLGMFYSNKGQNILAVRYLRQRVERGQADDPWTLQAQEELLKIYDKLPALKSERIQAQADVFSKQIVDAKKKMRITADRNLVLDFEIAYRKGFNLIEQKCFDDAIVALEAALLINPHNTAAKFALQRAKFGKEKLLLEQQTTLLKTNEQGRSVNEALNLTSTP